MKTQAIEQGKDKLYEQAIHRNPKLEWTKLMKKTLSLFNSYGNIV